MAGVKGFYGKRTQHHVLPGAVNQIQDDDPQPVDAFLTGPPTGGEGSGWGNEDNKILNETGLTEKIAWEVEVFNIRNDRIERMSFDNEDNYVEPPPAKKQKKKKRKKKLKNGR